MQKTKVYANPPQNFSIVCCNCQCTGKIERSTGRLYLYQFSGESVYNLMCSKKCYDDYKSRWHGE